MTFQIGYTPWNKGLTEIKTNNKGCIPWNKQKGIKKVCPICALEFSVSKSLDYRKFCSQKCYGQNKKGYKPIKSFLKGHIPWNKGKHIKLNNSLQEWIKKNGAWNKGKLFPQFSCENHPNWKGGSSLIGYPLGWSKTFKEQVRQRDNYKCQECGVPEIELTRKLHIHHIDYNKKNINIDNLISLCHSCHSKTMYTKKQDFWINYYQHKVKEVIYNG